MAAANPKEVPHGKLVKILMTLPKERLAEMLVERAGISAEWTDGETDIAVLRRWTAYETSKQGRSVIEQLAALA